MKIQKVENKRINIWVPRDLTKKVRKMAERHIPLPNKREFFIHLMKEGLNTVEQGASLKKPSKCRFKGADDKFQYYLPPTLIQRFNMVIKKQSPVPRRTSFLVYVICLGIEAYNKEYDEFGIKRD